MYGFPRYIVHDEKSFFVEPWEIQAYVFQHFFRVMVAIDVDQVKVYTIFFEIFNGTGGTLAQYDAIRSQI
jgi:hypothetical protein